MKCDYIVLLGLLSTLVESFPIVRSQFQRGPVPLAANNVVHDGASDANTFVDDVHDFWGSPRNEQEIIDFVSDAIFNNDDDSSQYHHQQSSPEVQQDQWVDVISAEPPVRRSDLTLYSK